MGDSRLEWQARLRRRGFSWGRSVVRRPKLVRLARPRKAQRQNAVADGTFLRDLPPRPGSDPRRNDRPSNGPTQDLKPASSATPTLTLTRPMQDYGWR